jgi:hypothetical protein
MDTMLMISVQLTTFVQGLSRGVGAALIRVIADTASAARSTVSKRSHGHRGGVSSVWLPNI